MPSIENISVTTNTLKPNGAIIGTLTNNNGVLSGFGTHNFFEIPNGRQANATYVMKFTTPATAPTGTTDILHIENWECIEQDASVFNTYNWETGSAEILLSNPSANTTYWVKSVHSGTTRTYYISTDGESYSQVASFSDNRLNVNFDSPSTLGNISITRLQDTRPYTGTIDLNGCYMEVGGNVVWRGMDYNNIQRVSGDEFDGQWVEKGQALSNGTTIAPNASFNYSLANYLGDSSHDYEVEFELFVQTGVTSGDCGEFYLYAGNTRSNVWNTRACRLRTRAAAFQAAAGTFILPISKTDQSVTIWAHSSSTIGDCIFSLGAVRYRRIGNNDTHSDYVSAISVRGTQYNIDGNFLNGNWVAKDVQLYNGTIAAASSKNCSLSDYLPNDGYSYEVLFTLRADTGTTNGNNVTGRVGYSAAANSNRVVCRHITRTASNMTCCGNVLLPVSARNIYVSNSGNTESGTMVLTARGYRRIGTNG